METEMEEKLLMSYLYGELSGKEKDQFEALLDNNAALYRKYKALSEVRGVIQQYEDREVTQPTWVIKTNTRGRWRNATARNILAVAAAIALLFTVGYLTNTEINLGSVNISFNKQKEIRNEPYLTKHEVNEMLANYDKITAQRINEKVESLENVIEAKVDHNTQVNYQALKQSLDRLMKVNKREIEHFVAQLSEEQRQQIEGFYVLNKEQQDIYFQTLLLDFAEFAEKQRQADLLAIQHYLSDFKDETDLKQLETDQILASIISQVKNAKLMD